MVTVHSENKKAKQLRKLVRNSASLLQDDGLPCAPRIEPATQKVYAKMLKEYTSFAEVYNRNGIVRQGIDDGSGGEEDSDNDDDSDDDDSDSGDEVRDSDEDSNDDGFDPVPDDVDEAHLFVRKYNDQEGTFSPIPTDIRKATNLPSVSVLNAFALYLSKTQHGRDQNEPLSDTVRRSMSDLYGAVARYSGREFDKETKKAVKNYCQGLGATKTPNQLDDLKHVYGSEDLTILLRYLWCEDTRLAPRLSERMRVQTAFLLNMLYVIGPRPGSIVESLKHRSSKHFVRYVDCTLTVHNDLDEDEPCLSLEIMIRHLKGYKRYEKQPISTPFYEVDLSEDGPSFCLISLFLALAFDDGAFEDIRTPEELLQFITSTPKGSHRQIMWRKNAKNLPVLRNRAGNRKEYLKYTRAQQLASLLALRAGFAEKFKFYSFRRNVGNTLTPTPLSRSRNEMR